MEREACVCDHGFERSDLCAEIIIIIITARIQDDSSTILVTMYYCGLLRYDWWLCMVINISVQYGGGLLPDITLLTQGYYQRGEPV